MRDGEGGKGWNEGGREGEGGIRDKGGREGGRGWNKG